MTDFDGTITGDNATGIYFRDRRIVAGMRLRLGGTSPTPLSGGRMGASNDRLTYGYWNNAADPQAIVVRERSLSDGYFERILIRGIREMFSIQVEIELAAGDATVYQLQDEDLESVDATALSDRLWLSDGWTVDGCQSPSNIIRFSQRVNVAPGETTSVSWGIQMPQPVSVVPPTDSDFCDRRGTRIEVSDPRLQASLNQAGWDLDALTVVDPHTSRPFLAAGSPHFLAVFGRDALLASLLALVKDPGRVLDTLDVLATHQGTRHNPETLEEPGRILHELRIGEMGVFGLSPGVPYFGSIDSTPLFVMALHEAMAWGAPLERIRALLPAARAAMSWCREHTDRFGFLQSIPHGSGIGNQAWKDSWDSIVRPDGSVVSEATSPVEVQGYVHQALLGLPSLERFAGDPGRAARLMREASRFASSFRRHFVVERHPVLVALALDAAGSAIMVRASNAGHLLSTEILDERSAGRLAERLLSDDEFSGWGIRTLASSEPAYNPLGYHVGSVWPHDSAWVPRQCLGTTRSC